MTRLAAVAAGLAPRGGARGLLPGLLSAAARSAIVRKVVETFAARVLLIGIGLGTSVLLARALGPEGRGQLAVAGVIGAMGAQLGNLGLHASNTYFVARDRARLPALLGNTLVVSLVLGGLGAAAAWAMLVLSPVLAPVHSRLLALALTSIPLGLAGMLVQNILLGVGEVRAQNAIELATRAASVCLIGLLVLSGLATPEAMFGASLAVTAAGLVWALGRLAGHLRGLPRPSLPVFRETVRYGFKAYLAALFAFLVLRADLLMVQYLAGSEAAGHYSIATSMADFVNLLPAVVGMILFPELSAMRDPGERWRVAGRAALAVGFVMLVVVIAAAALAGPLVQFLYGPAFAPAVPAFVWLMPGALFLAVEVVAVQFLNSSGFPRQVVGIWAACVLANIGLNLWAIPRYGAVGAAAASSASYLLVLGLVLRVVERTLRAADRPVR